MAEDLLIQYPTGPDDQIIQANTTKTILNRRINGMLRWMSVTVPENCSMIVYNNNIAKLFFTNESGTIEFPHGLSFEDTMIVISNASTTDPARITTRMVFTV